MNLHAIVAIKLIMSFGIDSKGLKLRKNPFINIRGNKDFVVKL